MGLVKAALQTLWKDRATITEYQEVQRENKSTGHQEIAVLENEPCKLSFETLATTNQTESAAELVQKAKLFIDNGLNIKAGSKITVTQHETGRVFEFSQSGDAGVFTNHQEIMLAPFEGWA
jgi:hypothetical protein